MVSGFLSGNLSTLSIEPKEGVRNPGLPFSPCMPVERGKAERWTGRTDLILSEHGKQRGAGGEGLPQEF